MASQRDAVDNANTSPIKSLNVLTFVAQTEVLLVWIIFSFLSGILLSVPDMVYVRYLTGPLWLIFGIPFLNYCMQIIELTARGHRQMPRMNSEIFTTDTRLYKLVFLFALLFPVYRWATIELKLIASLLLWLLVPAIVSFITFRYPLMSAFDPRNIWRFIRNMGISYNGLKLIGAWGLFCLGFLLSTGLKVQDSIAGPFLISCASTYLLLVMFRAAGAVLHYRRDKLGIRTDFSLEQTAQDKQRLLDAERARFTNKLHKLLRANKQREAWHRLNQKLKHNRYADESSWFQDIRRLEDPRLSYKMAQGYITRLLSTDSKQAWKIFTEIWIETSGRYQLDSGTTVLGLAGTAIADEQKKMIIILLDRFDQDFPNHPRSRQALLKAVELYDNLGEKEQARARFHLVTQRRGKIDPVKYEHYKNLLKPV